MRSSSPRHSIEQQVWRRVRTDVAAAHTLAPLPDDALRELLERLLPAVLSVIRTGVVPYPDAMGVPAPASTARA